MTGLIQAARAASLNVVACSTITGVTSAPIDTQTCVGRGPDRAQKPPKMALWICTDCGAAEELSFYPDCCSYCRGSMETQDGRSTCASDAMSDAEIEQATIWMNAAEDDARRDAGVRPDRRETMEKWLSGHTMSGMEQDLLDELLLENRVGLFADVFADRRAAA